MIKELSEKWIVPLSGFFIINDNKIDINIWDKNDLH
jgi:hypothetical protein